MYKISTLNKISPVGLKKLTDQYTITDDTENATGILVRSQDMHEMKFGKELLGIARAGAGVNNIPLDTCAEQGIVVFNTPGANANAVKELVLAALFLLARNIPAAMSWVNTIDEDIAKKVEKGKSQFAGTEIRGKVLGVVGLGAIGIMVANAAEALGMEVKGYDPYFNTKAALQLNPTIKVYDKLDDLLPLCNYVTVHVPAMSSTNGMFNKNLYAMMKDGTSLINFSRDKLINEDDLLDAIASGKICRYITDFPTDGLCGKKNIILMPHLGASTEEAEDNCATMATLQLMDYIENGNIINSVNFPTVTMGPKKGDNRISVITKGIENPFAYITEKFGSDNIKCVVGATKGDFGYVLISTGTGLLEQVDEKNNLDGIIKIRVIQGN